MAELWDVYDRYGNKLEGFHERGKPLAEGKYHLVVQILSVNNDGRILISKRHPDKKFGGMWEITGGSAVMGETGAEAAARELLEETGLEAMPSELEYYGSLIGSGEGRNTIYKFYLYNGDFGMRQLKPQEGETVGFRLCTPDEIKEMTDKGEFLDFVYYRIKAMFSEWI